MFLFSSLVSPNGGYVEERPRESRLTTLPLSEYGTQTTFMHKIGLAHDPGCISMEIQTVHVWMYADVNMQVCIKEVFQGVTHL